MRVMGQGPSPPPSHSLLHQYPSSPQCPTDQRILAPLLNSAFASKTRLCTFCSRRSCIHTCPELAAEPVHRGYVHVYMSSIRSLENNSVESPMSPEEIQLARNEIFASLPDYATDNLSSQQTSEFFTLINKYYANVAEGDRITAENMTEQEKTISRSVTDDLYYSFEASQFDDVDPQEGLSGLATIRCELLPQLLATLELSITRLQRLILHLLRIEHMFQHLFISNDSHGCDLIGLAEFENAVCKSSSPKIVQHASIHLEYELTD